ncbi:flavin-binding monooxygenase [Metarhizium robertsii]|uniref:Flavin-binding monooxygenase-like protein n=2 Tax=Metarhizium robertsii TaxID=568076 RepID=E9FBF1_METRA|nr:flavin-binding monooxygenase-like protein [Metarhizium robertsii ARSEF 23]EFY94889.1 flavin-binding monooxygenase-like protein [Metarhizium robertsii ARSEF 23]EXV01869.1 flavin-binding monooxygenase [Metarhizium robertsii]
MSMANMDSKDCVIIGAGFHGLAAAKQYRCSQPEHSVAVFDSQASIGGTWAEERLYPGLKTNNMFGTYEYPDFPMESGKFGAEPGQHIPARAVHEYLKSYAENFGLVPLICLETKVISAEHQEAKGGWVLTLQRHGETFAMFSQRLIVASGFTSEPNRVRFVGDESFGGRIFHGRDFHHNADTVKMAQSPTVYGSTKYAWDAVYAYAAAGAEVHWVIRDTRLLTWFSPCIWGSQCGHSWVRRLLHGTIVGRFITNLFWKILASDVLARCQLDSHPETRKLKPKLDAMFAGASFSILNYDTDFFDLVRNGRVKIHIADIERLSPGKVHLSDTTCFESDSILVHTGWKKVPPIKFLPEGVEAELGLPHSQKDGLHGEAFGRNEAFFDRADREILSQFQSLQDQPKCLKDFVPLSNVPGVVKAGRPTGNDNLTPFMLHRFIVPPSPRFLRHRDVAFCGMVMNFSTPILAHIQSLWIAAYMSGRLSRDATQNLLEPGALEELQYQTVLVNRFGKWRYPVDWGNKAPSFIFDAVPYFDVLLQDLGLNYTRKQGLLSYLFEPYGPQDYRDTAMEWLAKFRTLGG